MNDLIDIFAEASGNLPQEEESETAFEGLWAIDEGRVREVDYMQAEVFKKYHTETELMRYLKRLDRKDISLATSMIPLGSCTMKLNPAAAMIPVTFSSAMNVHPLAPEEQVSGYLAVMEQLKEQLCAITGFDACTLQPTSGAAGEYTGLVVIREYLKRQGQSERKVLLIPASAHGTNPASCVQAGFVPCVVKCDELGNTDLEDWRAKAEENKEVLAGCMITYPSTHGIFEQAIREMIHIVHTNGGYVYMDGANMNAQIGWTNPAYIGADVCHLKPFVARKLWRIVCLRKIRIEFLRLYMVMRTWHSSPGAILLCWAQRDCVTPLRQLFCRPTTWQSGSKRPMALFIPVLRAE